MKIEKLNSYGFDHTLLSVAFVVVFALAGVGYIVASHADSLTGGAAAPISSAEGCTNPFPKGWKSERLDMGWDGTFKKRIVAPCAGKIIYASDSFSNWGGYIELKLHKQPSQLATSTLYFAEGLHPTVQAGQHVKAGQTIAVPAKNHFNGTNGNIEWGLAQDGSVGGPTNTHVYGRCGSGGARQSVINFVKWARQNFHLKTPSSTDNAGCP